MLHPVDLKWRSIGREGLRYAVAVIAVAAAALLRWAWPGVLAETPYLAFYPAVVAAAAFGGLGPGVAATIGVLLCVGLLFDRTPGWVDLGDAVVLARQAIFLAGGLGISLVAGLRRSAQSGERRQARELAAAKQSAERAKAEAEEANRAKDHFLAVLSHELRTPLTPVVAAVSMLQQNQRLDEGMRENLEMIRRNVELEARLIDDLLDVTRIARGKIELDKRPVELCMVIARAVEVCRADLEARGLHFWVDLGLEAPYHVEADVGRLQQVFWNLLKNAIKFTPHGGWVGIRVRRHEGTEARRHEGEGTGGGGGSVVAEVIDSGVGIEAEALTRIFNAFEQAERSITRQFGGLGLGLAISKALVEMHGGTISAYSDGKGKGATFRVKLPLYVGAEHAPPFMPYVGAGHAPPFVPYVGAGHASPLRILLVEDHGDTAQMMKRLLEAEGHRVETAGDVATALAAAAERPFDLLISDLGLPDGSGMDLMRELRVQGVGLPAVALSGYGMEEDMRRSREAGFVEHLTKPVNVQRLLETVGRVGAH
jgi:two-component system CheB/CheR fusion protein